MCDMFLGMRSQLLFCLHILPASSAHFFLLFSLQIKLGLRRQFVPVPSSCAKDEPCVPAFPSYHHQTEVTCTARQDVIFLHLCCDAEVATCGWDGLTAGWCQPCSAGLLWLHGVTQSPGGVRDVSLNLLHTFLSASLFFVGQQNVQVFQQIQILPSKPGAYL